MRYQNRVLSNCLSLCTCNYPFYSAYKSFIHRVNFGQFKLSTDIGKNPGPSVYVDATKTIQNRVLSKYLFFCTCSYPFYSAYKSLIHQVNFGQFKLSTQISRRIQDLQFMQMLQKRLMLHTFKETLQYLGKRRTTMCCNEFVCFNLQ